MIVEIEKIVNEIVEIVETVNEIETMSIEEENEDGIVLVVVVIIVVEGGEVGVDLDQEVMIVVIGMIIDV